MRTIPTTEGNPQVLIKYEPASQLATLGSAVEDTIGTLRVIQKVDNLATLAKTGEALLKGEEAIDRVETFRRALCNRVAAAAEPFRQFRGFEDFSVTVTIKTWGVRSQLDRELSRLRGLRASYLAAEQEKERQAQAIAEANQAEINRKAAVRAANEAKKAGADAETVQAIKQDVMQTPAPLVQSRTASAAKDAGVSVRFKYYAKITDLKKFLAFVLGSPVMFNTLKVSLIAIEEAFNKMASDQKEAFTYPGATYDKRPVDVSRGRR